MVSVDSLQGSPAPVTNISSELEKACDVIKQTLKTQTVSNGHCVNKLS